jgi:hypothetical protein
MAVEDRIREAFDQLAASLRQEFEQRAQALATELTGAVAEDRMAAEADSISRMAAQVAAARAEAEERLAAERDRTREEARKELSAEVERLQAELSASLASAEAARVAAEGARAQAEELRGQAERARSEHDALRAQLEQARAEADAQRTDAGDARREADALRTQANDARIQADEARAQSDGLRAQIEEAQSQFEHVRAELAALRAQADEWQARTEEIRVEMEELRRAAAESRASAEEAQADLRQALERAAVAEQTAQAARGAEIVERQDQMAEIDRLGISLQKIGRAGSLSEVLSTLADTVALETGRTAVLVASGDGFAVFRSHGLGDAPKAPIPRAQLDDLSRGLPFAPLPEAHTGYSVPVEIGGKRVALVYADDLGDNDPPVPSAWPEAIEILARHAALRLELLTALRTVQAMTKRAGTASAPVATMGAVAPSRPARPTTSSTEDDQSARRFARLLVSEIKLYNESAVRIGRDRRDLSRRLGTEIERARRLYEERVPATVPARATYFDDELVKILADGDPALLGR